MQAVALLPSRHAPAPPGLRALLGEPAWLRLSPRIRQRFAEDAGAAEYVGSFEVVRASCAGWLIAQLCRLLGTPVAPRTGSNVPATVRVIPTARGVLWLRDYHWPDAGSCTVRSTKVVSAEGELIEELPALLRMTLQVFERGGVLNFVSRGYFFELPLSLHGRRLRLQLPDCLTPGTTHVEHRDEERGWFRFTLYVQHALLGEVFYQTGRFHAAGDRP